MNYLRELFSLFSAPETDPTRFQGTLELLGLMSRNILTLLLAATICTVILRTLQGFPTRKTAQQIGIAAFLLLPWLVRLFNDGYAYDTSLGSLSRLSDITLFSFCCFLIGEKFVADAPRVVKVSIGIAFLTLLSLLLMFFRLNALLPRPSLITNLIFIGVVGYFILKRAPYEIGQILGRESSVTLFVIFLFGYCFNYYLWVSLPPDADITTMVELTGYLFQGQNLHDVVTGFGEEWILRYPGGFPSLTFAMSHLLDVRASEAVLLFWYLAFFVFVFSLISLGNRLSLNPFLVALFSLNGAITGYFGLQGGGAFDMLCYAFGLIHITLILDKRWLAAAISLGAAMVIQPLIAVPFCFVFGASVIWNLSKEQLGGFLRAAAVLVPCVAYLAFLGFGPRSTPSKPEILLSELTPSIFTNNIVKYFQEDTFGYGFLLLAIPVFSIFFAKTSKQSAFMFYPWLLGCLLLDGTFGDTQWGARFQKSFNLVAIWILSVGLSHRLWDLSWGAARNRFLSWNKKVFSAASMAGIVVFLVFWFVVAAPQSIIFPAPVYGNHGGIRMGRFIDENLPQDVLIYFQRTLYTTGGDDYLNTVRGDSSRNSLEARMSDHQVKFGEIKSREAAHFCIQEDATYTVMENCLLDLGINYLWFDVGEDIPETREFLGEIPFALVHQVGTSYLYRLGT